MGTGSSFSNERINGIIHSKFITIENSSLNKAVSQTSLIYSPVKEESGIIGLGTGL